MTTNPTVSSFNSQTAEVKSPHRPLAIGTILESPDHSSIRLVVHASSTNHRYHCLILSGSSFISQKTKLTVLPYQLMVPTGKHALGRLIDINLLTTTKSADTTPVFADPPPKKSVTTTSEIWETGIKAIDFFSPLIKGGKIGLLGGAGVGKTVLLSEILFNIVSRDTKAKAIFAGIGERSREASELFHTLSSSELIDNISLIVSPMGESAGFRYISAHAAAAIAGSLRDSGYNVVVMLDNMFRFAQAGNELALHTNKLPSEDGYQASLFSEIASIQEQLVSTTDGAISTIQAIYLPADDPLDSSTQTILPYLHSIVSLARDTYQLGYFPSIDLINSQSSLISQTTSTHSKLVTAAKQLLIDFDNFTRLVSLIGLEELSPENRARFQRGQILKNYFTQPFHTLTKQTGVDGVYVPLSATLEDVATILSGKLDDTDPGGVKNIGKIVI